MVFLKKKYKEETFDTLDIYMFVVVAHFCIDLSNHFLCLIFIFLIHENGCE